MSLSCWHVSKIHTYIQTHIHTYIHDHAFVAILNLVFYGFFCRTLKFNSFSFTLSYCYIQSLLLHLLNICTLSICIYFFNIHAFTFKCFFVFLILIYCFLWSLYDIFKDYSSEFHFFLDGLFSFLGCFSSWVASKNCL